MASSNTSAVLNKATRTAKTHEGLAVAPSKPLQELRRTVLACLLFESNFYEDGQSVAGRITAAAHKVSITEVLNLAAEARRDQYLRHVPLWLIVAALSHPQRKPVHSAHIAAVIDAVCDRPDQLGELVAQYWRDGKRPLANALRDGLRKALGKFNDYQLAKYAQKGAVRVRDVMFLTHPKPKDDEQKALWAKLANDELKSHDTWEDQLSAGGDKKKVFTDLLSRHKLGGLALVRNLRNMEQAGVDKKLVSAELERIAPTSRILPFQFLSAARACPAWEDMLEQPMLAAVADLPKLPGKTVLLVDTSGSMSGKLSAKSQLDRLDGARALAMLMREVCEEVVVIAFQSTYTTVPSRRGFALADAIPRASGGTDTARAVAAANKLKPERIVIFTDEQSNSYLPAPYKAGYVMNVASYQNGITWGKWVGISGFSDSLVRFIHEAERAKLDEH